MTEHTPGAWVSRDVTDTEDESCGDWVVEIPETPGNTVTRLWFGDMENNTGEDIANANLVAAAPALLAACEAMVRRCRGQMPDPRYPAWHDTCCEAARAAIAQARGEQP